MALFPSTVIASAAGGYDIDNSCRFNSPDTAILYRVPSTTGNQKTYTISFWWKFGGLVNAGGSQNYIITSWHTSGTGGGRYWIIRMQTNQIRFSTGDASDLTDPSPTAMELRTNRLFRDPSAWYHICLSVDTTQATASNRGKIYVNGVQETSLATATYGSQNDIHFINHTNTTMQVGGINASGWSPTANYCADGYIAEYHQIDGTALGPDSFGEVDEDYGHWKPKKVSGVTYGTNGFHLDFANSGSLGNDAAGSNNLSSTGLAASDQMLDSPTNNFSVFNSLDNYWAGNTYAEGNLKVTTGLASYARVNGTIGVTSGKWYFEMYQVTKAQYNNDGGNYISVGISERGATANDANQHPGASSDSYGYYSTDGTKLNNAPGGSGRISYGASYTVGDIVGVAFDLDNHKIYFSKNGTWQDSGDPTSGATGTGAAFSLGTGRTYRPSFSDISGHATGPAGVCVFNFGQDGTFAGAKTAQGNSDSESIGNFYYAVPSGFKALCSKNFPEPTVKPKEHFNVKLYDDGAGAKTGVGFAPELIWLKARGSAYNHKMCDVIQGTGKALQPNVGDAQITEATGLTAFGTDGFTVGSDTDYSDTTGDGMVAWCWKLGGTASANTNGSITSSVSANVTAGVSVGTWTGSGANATIGHGLSKAPDVIVVHAYNSPDSWPYGMIAPYASIDFTDYLRRDSYTGVADSDIIWNDTAPTASVFSVGSGAATNASGATWRFEAYHAVEGFSAFGSYLGNNNVDGSFCYTGFRPKWIMIKGTSGTTGWSIVDTARESFNPSWKETPIANNTHVEDQSGSFYKDFLSNGFKIRCSSCSFFNYSGRHYVWAAFAEYPFKYTNAH